MRTQKLLLLALAALTLAGCMGGCGQGVSSDQSVALPQISSIVQGDAAKFEWQEQDPALLEDRATDVLALPSRVGKDIALTVDARCVSGQDILCFLYNDENVSSDGDGIPLAYIDWYNLAQQNATLRFDVDENVTTWRALHHEAGFDFVLFFTDDAGEPFYKWYRWKTGQEAPEKIHEANYPYNWQPELLFHQGESCIVSYNESTNQLMKTSADGVARTLVSLQGKQLLDMNINSNGQELLLVVRTANTANFCVYRDGKLVAERELKENERLYAGFALDDGILLYLQDVSSQNEATASVCCNLVWWPFDGEESMCPYNVQLYRGVSNQTNQVIFQEFKSAEEVVLHTFRKQSDGIVIDKTILPEEFSSLPASLSMQSGENIVCLFTVEADAVLCVS